MKDEIIFPDKTQKATKETTIAMLTDLAERGPVEHRTNALAAFAARLIERKVEVPNLGMRLAWMEQMRWINRDINGKRTIRISLLGEPELPPCPDKYLLIQEPPVVVEEIPLDEEELQVPELTLTDRLVLIMRLAGDSLHDVPMVSDELLKERLGRTLEENQTLRHKLDEAQDSAAHYKSLYGAAMMQNRALEANVETLRNGQHIDDSGYRALRRLMKAPQSTKGQ